MRVYRCILVVIFFVLILSTSSAQKVVSIGIITDLEEFENKSNEVNKSLIDDIQKVIGSLYKIKLYDNNVIMSNSDLNVTTLNYKKLSERCDIILLIGGLSIKGALQEKEFIKPTIAIGALSISLQNLPYISNNTSGRRNFSYILSSQSINKEIDVFRNMIDFKNLTFLFDNKVFSSLDKKKMTSFKKMFKMKFDLNVDLLSINRNDIESSLSNLSDQTDAVYISIPFEYTDNQYKKMTSVLNNKKILSFAMDKSIVSNGALMCFTDNYGFDYILKKVGVMVDEVLRGESLEEMHVKIQKPRELYVNMFTADVIDFNPDFKTLIIANKLGNKTESNTTIYSIQDIIKRAISENLDIKLSKIDEDLSDNDIKTAWSNYMPNISASGTGSLIDRNRPNPLGDVNEKSIVASLNFEQVLFSESILANIKIQKYLAEAQKHATEMEVLSQILNCYSSYFSLLQAKTNSSIQKENLLATKTNYQLAEIRRSSGHSSNADVYRWESELAKSHQKLIEAETNLIISKSQLNALLNNSLEDDFDIEDVKIDDKLFEFFNNSVIMKNISSKNELKRMTDFLILEAKNNNPSKKYYLSNLKAIERQILMNKRKYYLPTLALAAQINQKLYRGGLGSEPPVGNSFYDNTWNVGLVLKYPIFDGNRKRIDLKRSKIKKRQLTSNIENLDVDISLAINTRVLKLVSSSTARYFSKISYENAHNNFELVQNQYKQGAVGITQLIDAQNATLQTKLAYASSVYEYIVSYLHVENSIGYYSMLATKKESRAIKERYMNFLLNNK